MPPATWPSRTPPSPRPTPGCRFRPRAPRPARQVADDGAGDARLRVALRSAEYGFTQTIAAAPQLVGSEEALRPARFGLTGTGTSKPVPLRHRERWDQSAPAAAPIRAAAV
jgi:hypothetical protein